MEFRLALVVTWKSMVLSLGSTDLSHSWKSTTESKQLASEVTNSVFPPFMVMVPGTPGAKLWEVL